MVVWACLEDWGEDPYMAQQKPESVKKRQTKCKVEGSSCGRSKEVEGRRMQRQTPRQDKMKIGIEIFKIFKYNFTIIQD